MDAREGRGEFDFPRPFLFLLRARRKELGLSQEKMALVAGMDRAYVGRIERGERNVTFLVLCRLCETLRCDVAALTEGIPTVAKGM